VSAWILLGAIPLAGISGFVRGVTGFGGAMVFTAPMALLTGPRQAVAVALLLEAFAALHMLPRAVREGHMRVIAPICAAACLTVPLGGHFLATLEPQLLRKAIAASVLAMALLLLYGLRYAGPPRLPTSLALGALSGTLAAATSVGAPPVILYLLAGPDPVAVTRANLTLFVMVLSAAALAVLYYRGILDIGAAGLALALAPFFFGGVSLGNRVFPRIDAGRFRRGTLVLLILLAVAIFVT
jgi:uncharacterized membrane protein YfcA